MQSIRNIFLYVSRRHVSGGILSMVLGISLIIASICTSLIVLAYYNRLSNLKSAISLKVINNAQSGIHYLLAQRWEETSDFSELKDLYGLENDSVLLVRKPWGFFDIGISDAFSGKHKHGKIALMGAYPQNVEKSALYLSDEGVALKVSGDTEIRGYCHLPKMGVRDGNINGRGYSGSSFIYGAVATSKSTLPELSNKLLSNIAYFRSSSFLNNAIFVDKLESGMKITFKQSETGYYHDSRSITINENLEGNIVIVSDYEINISARAHLRNIIVMAPKIYIEDNFKGKLQAFATDTLMVGRNCIFDYPTVLAVGGENENALLAIDEGTQIFGVVFLNSLNGSHEKKLLKISEDTQIIGQVYANGMVEHKGKILGSLICKSFLLRNNNIYLNYLHDAVIDVASRPKHYIGIPICFSSEKNGVVEWLD